MGISGRRLLPFWMEMAFLTHQGQANAGQIRDSFFSGSVSGESETCQWEKNLFSCAAVSVQLGPKSNTTPVGLFFTVGANRTGPNFLLPVFANMDRRGGPSRSASVDFAELEKRMQQNPDTKSSLLSGGVDRSLFVFSQKVREILVLNSAK